MAPSTVAHPQDDDYDSAADSDFGGSLSPSSGDDSSASDGARAKGTKGRSRKKRSIEDSGDEGVVKEGKKKRRKKGKADHDAEEGTEESAIGMRVRDRKLGRAADRDEKPLATSEGATADIDALWARLNSAAPTKTASSPPRTNNAKDEEGPTTKDNPDPEEPPAGFSSGGVHQIKPAGPPSHTTSEERITIKRTYQFAGETITEKKTVPKSSAEARLYLQSQAQSQPLNSASPVIGVKGLPPTTPNSGPKLNTIEKSKLDWASHVDKEGLKEELDTAEKAKGGYIGRMEFLGRSEAKRQEDLKNARTK
ncbi:MAG: hypothetical protein Q9196_006707 [Gyalolechia fulgens]